MNKNNKGGDYYTHQIENANCFLGPLSLSKNCQEFRVNKPTKRIKFLNQKKNL